MTANNAAILGRPTRSRNANAKCTRPPRPACAASSASSRPPPSRRATMPTTPAGRYTRQRIRELALNRAGNRQLERDATDFLAQHLFELYTLADWPFLYTDGAGRHAGPRLCLARRFQCAARRARVATRRDRRRRPRRRRRSPLSTRERFDSCADVAAGGPPGYWMVTAAATRGVCSPDPTGRGARGRAPLQAVAARPDARPSSPPTCPSFRGTTTSCKPCMSLRSSTSATRARSPRAQVARQSARR